MSKMSAQFHRCGVVHRGVTCGGLFLASERAAHMLELHGLPMDDNLWTIVVESEFGFSTTSRWGSVLCECGDPKEPKASSCLKCRKLQAPVGSTVRRVAAENPRNAAYNRKYRAEAIADGLCSRCLSNTPESGYKQCEACKAEERERGPRVRDPA